MNIITSFEVVPDSILWQIIENYIMSTDFSHGNIILETNLSSLKEDRDRSKLSIGKYVIYIDSNVDYEPMFMFTDIGNIKIKKIETASLDIWEQFDNTGWIITLLDLDYRICDIYIHSMRLNNAMTMQDTYICKMIYQLNTKEDR